MTMMEHNIGLTNRDTMGAIPFLPVVFTFFTFARANDICSLFTCAASL
jgi:hypothetical protein